MTASMAAALALSCTCMMCSIQHKLQVSPQGTSQWHCSHLCTGLAGHTSTFSSRSKSLIACLSACATCAVGRPQVTVVLHWASEPQVAEGRRLGMAKITLTTFRCAT